MTTAGLRVIQTLFYMLAIAVIWRITQLGYLSATVWIKGNAGDRMGRLALIGSAFGSLTVMATTLITQSALEELKARAVQRRSVRTLDEFLFHAHGHFAWFVEHRAGTSLDLDGQKKAIALGIDRLEPVLDAVETLHGSKTILRYNTLKRLILIRRKLTAQISELQSLRIAADSTEPDDEEGRSELFERMLASFTELRTILSFRDPTFG